MSSSRTIASTKNGLPNRVRIVEVGPRDGLQNEKASLPIAARIKLIERLISAGLKTIEAGSFVSPKWVPQMAGTDQVLAAVSPHDEVTFPVLVPNMRGLDLALQSGAQTITIFPATTGSFSVANLNGRREDIFERFAEVARSAIAAGLRVRGSVSCALHCPYEGWVSADTAASLGSRLADLGCYEVVFCDTTGNGTPDRARKMTEAAIAAISAPMVAVHYHDTKGFALANTLASLELGIAAIDSSVGGLGGCPYSPGAAGNLSTEGLVAMLNDLGVESGVDLQALMLIGQEVRHALGRPPSILQREAACPRDQGQCQEKYEELEEIR